MQATGLGLRERKKQLTRASLADAALQLAAEKGLDHLTIDEIANVAFVSPRTFSNYFSCKEEAVMTAGAQVNEMITELYAASAASTASEQPLEGLARALVAASSTLTEDELSVIARQIELSREHPGLRPYEVARYDALEQRLRLLVAERVGVDPDHDLYPGLLAAAAVSTLRSALTVWAIDGAKPDRLSELISAAVEQIAGGLQLPPHLR